MYLIAQSTIDLIVVIVGIALIVGMGTFLIVRIIQAVKRATKERKEGLQKEKYISADDFVEAMVVKGDYYVMDRNVIYSVGANGQILPGKYRLKSAIEGNDTFNVRYNGLVSQMHNAERLVLSEGDTVCAVSNSVLICEDKND